MHELGIVYQIVKTVDEVKKENQLKEIASIVLQIGEMRDIVPKFIEEAWQAVRETTDYPTAEMQIEVITARARCISCGYEAPVRELGINCPECNGTDFKIISGREFIIKEIKGK